MSLTRKRINPSLAALAVLVFGLLIAGLSAVWQKRSNQELAQAKLKDLSTQAVQAVTERMTRYDFGLLGMRGVVQAVGEASLDRAQFLAYSSSRDYDREFPGARGFGLIWRVDPEKEAAFVEKARNNGWPNFKVRQLEPHDGERFVIEYIEPVERNRQAVGLDIASEASRRNAALQAMRSGKPILTAPITLVQASGRPLRSFLLMLPVYAKGASLLSEAERERACVGWSYAPLVIDEVLTGLSLSNGQLALALVDHEDDNPSPFYRAPAEAVEGERALKQSIDFSLFGRNWAAQLQPTPAFYDELHLTNPYELAALLSGVFALLASMVYLLMVGQAGRRQVQFEQGLRAAIVEGSSDAIVIESLDGKVVDWNPGAVRIFGFSTVEAIGRRLHELVVPVGGVSESDRILADVREGRAVLPFEFACKRRDGGVLQMSVVVSPLHNAQGQCIGLSRVMRDNTATHLAQEELAQLNDELETLVDERNAELASTLHDFRNIMDAVPSMIGYWDRELICRVANSSYQAWLGPEGTEVIGQRMQALLSASAFAINWPHIEAVLRGEAQTFERAFHPEGGESDRHLIVYFVPDVVNGEVRGFYSLSHEVTELVESRLRMAAAQRDTAALLQTLHQHAIVSVTDRAGNITDVNHNFCAISGYSRDELLGMNHRLVNSGLHDAAFWDAMWQTISSGKSWHGAICNRARDGSVYWVDSVIAPFFGADGEIESFISIRSDITASKLLQGEVERANQQLAGRERFLREITDNLPVHIAYLDREGHFQFVNATYCESLGQTRESIIGKTCVDVFGGTVTSKSLALYDAVLKGAPERLEHEETVAGGVVYLDTHLVPDVDDSGAVVGLYMVSNDISKRRQAERELNETMALLNGVLAAASQVSIIAVKPDGVVSVFNVGAEKLLGYCSDEVVGKLSSIAFHDVDEMRGRAQILSDRWGRKIHTREVLIVPEELGELSEWAYVCKDGSRVPVSLGVTAMRDRQGELVGYLGIARDVRPQKEQERSLREAMHKAKSANQAKSQFLANMSHEIRTPMNAVIGLSYLLERTVLDAEQMGFLAKIKLASKSLLSLINGILDLSKIEAGELKIERAPFSPRALLQEICELVSVQSDAKGIGFDAGMPTNLPAMLEGDSTRLHQVLVNLLTNAIKFTEAGAVRLWVHQVDETAGSVRLRFVVKDSGIGMSPEQVARLFKPFAQADASTTRRFGGTGLGLSIVKQLVQLMGGQLGVNSKPAQGSEFWVELDFDISDAEAVPVALPRPASSAEQGLGGIRVLVADDSEINLEVARRVLELEGAEVTLACHGQDAVDKLLAKPDGFDVVLLDLQMPVLDGFDACRRIRGGLGLHQLPIIALSASTLSSEMALAKAAGVNDFMSKPFDAAKLVERIRRWVHSPVGVKPDGRSTLALPLDAQPEVPVASGWPAIDGVNSEAARKRLGGDKDLFLSMLKRLVIEFADVGVDTQLPLSQSPSELAARLHKLKGSAGTLGALSLERAAALADAACRNGQADKAPALLADVAAEVERLKQATAPFFEARSVEQRSSLEASSEAPAMSRSDLDGLILMLSHADLEAVDRFTALVPSLAPALGEAVLVVLQEKIDNLEFEDAVDILKGYQAQTAS